MFHVNSTYGGSVSEVVVVGVDTATQFRCLDEPLSHQLICAVVRNVQLEEASVGQGEPVLIHVRIHAHFMLSRQARQVRG